MRLGLFSAIILMAGCIGPQDGTPGSSADLELRLAVASGLLTMNSTLELNFSVTNRGDSSVRIQPLIMGDECRGPVVVWMFDAEGGKRVLAEPSESIASCGDRFAHDSRLIKVEPGQERGALRAYTLRDPMPSGEYFLAAMYGAEATGNWQGSYSNQELWSDKVPINFQGPPSGETSFRLERFDAEFYCGYQPDQWHLWATFRNVGSNSAWMQAPLYGVNFEFLTNGTHGRPHRIEDEILRSDPITPLSMRYVRPNESFQFGQSYYEIPVTIESFGHYRPLAGVPPSVPAWQGLLETPWARFERFGPRC